MKIVSRDSFTEILDTILYYIAEDSPNKALIFNDELEEKLQTIPYMPYKYRKSIYFDDENIRDYIFKGYVIPYLIDKNNNEIALLDMIKWVNK